MTLGDPPPTGHRDLVYFTAYDPSVALPGNATVFTCRIIVPFKHTLVSAWMTSTDIDKVGVVGGGLYQGDDGDAKAGTAIGDAFSSSANADKIDVQEITLAETDKVAAAAGRAYHLALVGTNAGDKIEQPTLTIAVRPEPRAGVA